MLEIKTWRNPYDTGVNMTTPKTIALKEGLTVLVGCNGAGKSTLLLNIKEYCDENKIPVHLWDNLVNGGNTSVLGTVLAGLNEEGDDMSMGIGLLYSSEGEAIKINIGRDSRRYKEFLKTGHYKDKNHAFAAIFNDKYKEDSASKQRVLLFDAADSGLSVDSIVEIKDLFKAVIQDAKEMGLELYLVISANEYELARGEECFDVNKGQYLTFADYEDYRSFIIKSRALKEKRIKKEQDYSIKKKQKEEAAYQKRVAKYTQMIEKIISKCTKNTK